MYRSGLNFERTQLELDDMFVSWARSDQAFFAAGACHILAFLFKQLHQDEGYEIRHIRPVGGLPGNHVYVTDGFWAFDHNGWTPEEVLLAVNASAYRLKYPGWDYDLVDVADGLEDFCAATYHRPPAYFAYLPWERTYKFIKQFPSVPPSEWLEL
jgi:hypothetical protein